MAVLLSICIVKMEWDLDDSKFIDVDETCLLWSPFINIASVSDNVWTGTSVKFST